MNDQQSYPAAGLAGNRAARCFLAALFTAGVSMALVSLFGMVDESVQPHLFGLVLAIAFVGAQIQERLRRLSD